MGIDDRYLQLAAILLMPMVPAVFFYWLLPGSATVSGPFKKLNIRLTGAFAGYFLLVLVSYGYFTIKGEKTESRFEQWQIIGEAKLDGANPSELNSNLLEVSLYPPHMEPSAPPVNNKIGFIAIMPVRREPNGGVTFKFNKLLVRYPNYERAEYTINDQDLTGDKHTLDVGELALQPEQPVPKTDEKINTQSKWETK